MEGVIPNRDGVLHRCFKGVLDLEKERLGVDGLVPNSLVPPMASFIKVNYDGILELSSLEGGVGVMARDSSGHFLASLN